MIKWTALSRLTDPARASEGAQKSCEDWYLDLQVEVIQTRSEIAEKIVVGTPVSAVERILADCMHIKPVLNIAYRTIYSNAGSVEAGDQI